MSYQFIQLEVKEGLATITLKREPLNVLNIAMMKEINAALDTLKGQSFKLLLFKAAGKAFSAGVDVGEHLGDQVNEMIEVFHGIFRRMDSLPAVSIASVQGAALGGAVSWPSTATWSSPRKRPSSGSRRSRWAFSRPLPP